MNKQNQIDRTRRKHEIETSIQGDLILVECIFESKIYDLKAFKLSGLPLPIINNVEKQFNEIKRMESLGISECANCTSAASCGYCRCCRNCCIC